MVELGCGIGLPSMVCAALGARVLATDLPQALEASGTGNCVDAAAKNRANGYGSK